MKRFVADRMLGRLARMLRLLGYDTLYLPELAPSGLEEIAHRDGRIILTRGETRLRFRRGNQRVQRLERTTTGTIA